MFFIGSLFPYIGKKDAAALGEASWNGPSPSWMEQLGALGSINSDMAHNNTVRHNFATITVVKLHVQLCHVSMLQVPVCVSSTVV